MDDHTTYTIFWPWHTTLILTIAVSSPGARHRCQAWSRTIEAFRRRLGIWCFFWGIWATKMGSRSIFDDVWWDFHFHIFHDISRISAPFSEIYYYPNPPKSQLCSYSFTEGCFRKCQAGKKLTTKLCTLRKKPFEAILFEAPLGLGRGWFRWCF